MKTSIIGDSKKGILASIKKSRTIDITAEAVNALVQLEIDRNSH